MKLESQVTSLEVSKKLKELGMKQESLFSWWHKWEGSSDEDAGKDILTLEQHSNTIKIASAFTVAELDQILMKTDYAVIALHDGHWVFKRKKDTTLEYGMIGGHGMGPEDNGADKRGNLIAYLLENNLLPQGKLK